MSDCFHFYCQTRISKNVLVGLSSQMDSGRTFLNTAASPWLFSETLQFAISKCRNLVSESVLLHDHFRQCLPRFLAMMSHGGAGIGWSAVPIPCLACDLSANILVHGPGIDPPPPPPRWIFGDNDFWIAQYVSFQYLLVCKMNYSAFRDYLRWYKAA